MGIQKYIYFAVLEMIYSPRKHKIIICSPYFHDITNEFLVILRVESHKVFFTCDSRRDLLFLLFAHLSLRFLAVAAFNLNNLLVLIRLFFLLLFVKPS